MGGNADPSRGVGIGVRWGKTLKADAALRDIGARCGPAGISIWKQRLAAGASRSRTEALTYLWSAPQESRGGDAATLGGR